ncbi:MAG: hypothetical protein UV64_C0007G0025 [Parcubacteria group bacterium GW2011_GWC1_43_11b]|nr:MAG: hypothetical protein UV64_C0007G0025 [Parcubacteria group bacterium GW2011_GWC1_43_11b]
MTYEGLNPRYVRQKIWEERWLGNCINNHTSKIEYSESTRKQKKSHEIMRISEISRIKWLILAIFQVLPASE